MDTLTEMMKKLRLTNMQQTYEARLGEAETVNLSCREFLNILLQDELQWRDAKGLARRLLAAHFEEEKTFESLKLELFPSKTQKLLRDLITGHYLAAKQHVLIMGPVGAGKTHLAQALGHHACRMGKHVLFIRANVLLRHLYASRADNSWERVFKKYLVPDLLIVDDFGLQPLTAAQSEDMYELIAERHLKASFIFTSNRSVESWVGLFSDPVMANAALDRLSHAAHHVILECESYRRKNRPLQVETAAAA